MSVVNHYFIYLLFIYLFVKKDMSYKIRAAVLPVVPQSSRFFYLWADAVQRFKKLAQWPRQRLYCATHTVSHHIGLPACLSYVPSGNRTHSSHILTVGALSGLL